MLPAAVSSELHRDEDEAEDRLMRVSRAVRAARLGMKRTGPLTKPGKTGDLGEPKPPNTAFGLAKGSLGAGEGGRGEHAGRGSGRGVGPSLRAVDPGHGGEKK